MNFGLQMWLERKVNTGQEQPRFRFVPCEAESAEPRPRETCLHFSRRHREVDSFPKGRDAVPSRKERPRSSGHRRVRTGMQGFGPLSRVTHSPVPLWPRGGHSGVLLRLGTRTPGWWGKVFRSERILNIPIIRSTLLVSFIQKEETGRSSKKRQRGQV